MRGGVPAVMDFDGVVGSLQEKSRCDRWNKAAHFSWRASPRAASQQ
jgi:hypothetical protein